VWPANYNNLASLSLIFSVKHFSILKTEEEGLLKISVPTYRYILEPLPKIQQH